MPRGDRSRHPYRGVSGSFRGTVGYRGVSADDAADPAVVFPPRPVTVPAESTAPLTAGSDTIEAGGGAVAVDNGSDPPATVATLVAGGASISGDAATPTPGLTFFPDNGYYQLDGGTAVGFQWPGDVSAPGADVHLQLDAFGVGVHADTGVVWVTNGDGSVDVFKANAQSGTFVTTRGSLGFLVMSVDGNDTYLQITAGGVITMPNLPTSDPANAGQLWNDAGTLKVSAG